MWLVIVYMFFAIVNVVIDVSTDQHVWYLEDLCEFRGKQRIVLADANQFLLDREDVCAYKTLVVVYTLSLDTWTELILRSWDSGFLSLALPLNLNQRLALNKKLSTCCPFWRIRFWSRGGCGLFPSCWLCWIYTYSAVEWKIQSCCAGKTVEGPVFLVSFGPWSKSHSYFDSSKWCPKIRFSLLFSLYTSRIE